MTLWITITLLIIMTVLLIKEVADMSMVIFGTLVVFLIIGIVSPSEAFSGFSNQGTLTIGFLYVMAYAIQSTGILNRIGSQLLGKPEEPHYKRLLRLLYPIATASTVTNNTPIVAMMIPMVKRWCQRHQVAPSKILLMVSYATILGGMCTLIGTSTNLVVHGMLLSNGFPGFSFFGLGYVGLPLMIVGVLLCALILYRFLPDRKEAIITLGESTREFVVAMKVSTDYPHINQSVEDAGLRHLNGLFLFQIERDGSVLAPVTPDEKIQLRDRLFFTGVPGTIVDLQKEPGLEVIRDVEFDIKNYDSNKYQTFEVVISSSSPLVGQKVRESNFRGEYDAVILGIHRNGHRINKKIGDIILQEGDTLLILAPKTFHTHWYHSNDFLLVSNSEQLPSREKGHTNIIFGVFFLMIIAVVSGLMPMIVAATAAVMVLLVTKSVSAQEAVRAINWKVLIIVAASLGIGKAVQNAGLAQVIAQVLHEIVGQEGPFLLIAVVMLTTMIYSMMVTNIAAAAILFPVALVLSGGSEHLLMPLAYAVTIGATASFMSPISYQTNLMVYGPGGYRYSDYVRVGLPVSLLVWLGGSYLIYLKFFG